MTAPLPPPILRYVSDFVTRRRRCALIRAGGVAVAFALAWLLAGCLADRWLALPGGVRLGILLAGAAGFLGILLRPLRLVLRSRMDWLEAAGEIESSTPAFGQRLRTVVSQLMERAEYRGSPRMLEQLLAEVTATAQSAQPRSETSWGRLLWPWALGAALAGGMLALRLAPDLGLPTLLARLVRPLAAIPPVTTTRIALDARSQFPRGDTLTVRARVERLAGGGVEIYTSLDARNWSQIPMLPGPGGEYVFSLPGMDRDVFYYVEAGDARTEVRKATVLNPPAVIEYRIRYDYPAYTDRGSATLSSNDGVIDALAGTQASVLVLCTEPIRSGAIVFPSGERLALSRTGDPAIMSFDVELLKSQSGDLELTSAAGLTTRIASGISLRAQPDHEPIVKLLQPGDDLRLDPRAVLPVQYQAMDDFGLVEASLAVQVNTNDPRYLALPRTDPRRLEGVVPLDLATLNVSIGDVVTLAVEGKDGAGRRSASEARHVLVAPRSIDLNTHARIAELKQAQAMSRGAAAQLRSAAETLERIRHRGEESEGENLSDHLKISRQLADAVEASMACQQALLRACARSTRSEQALAIVDCIDRSRALAARCDRLATLDAQGLEEQLWDQLRAAVEPSRDLAAHVRVLWEGEQADAVLTDRGNLKVKSPVLSPRLQETLARAREDLAASVEELGLKATARDLDEQLQRRSEAARQAMRSARVVDFEAAAAEWSHAVRKGETLPPPLPERLLAAAAAEAVRFDANPVRARDLQLAARAASRLLDLPLHERDGRPSFASRALAEFPRAIGALQRLHRHAPGDAPEAEAIQKAAEQARSNLGAWAAATARTRDPAADAEDLALEASARTWQRNYDAARSADRRFASRMRSDAWPEDEPDPWVEEAEKIDQTSSQQDALAAGTAQGRTVADAQRLESKQLEVTEQIARLAPSAPGDSRSRATAAMQIVQEQLALMPQVMTAAIDASEAYRQAAARAEQARRDADAAIGDRKGAWERMAVQAEGAMAEAEGVLDKAILPISGDAADEMGKQLRAFEPETQQAGLAIVEQLQPALQMLGQALKSPDRKEVERAAAQARGAIEVTQGFLRDAQVKLMEQDPLQAARWFAEASARALAERPPDFQKAHGRQEQAGLALSRAWQYAVRNGAMERLSLTPGFRPILTTRPATQPSNTIARMVPSLRQWGFLNTQTPSSLSAPTREADPPGYGEALKLYFQGLSKPEKPADKSVK